VTQALSGVALYEDLRQRRVDFIVGRMMSPILDKDLSGEILFDESLLVVAGRQNRWARRRRIELAELINEPWVIPPSGRSGDGATVGALIADEFRLADLAAPQATVVSTSIPLLQALLTTGPFLAMLPQSVLSFSTMRQSLRILPMKLRGAHPSVGIVTLRERTLSPAAQLFIKHVREVARPLAKVRNRAAQEANQVR
jgi:DNA-binding transcriptional LysR family regulator